MSEYFPEPKSLEGKVKVELGLPNYCVKIDIANFVKQTDFSNKLKDIASYENE